MLSKRLKICRKQKKLTQTELAEKVKTTKGTISNYENGHSSPSNEMLRDLADALDTTTDYLLGRVDNHSSVIKETSEFEQAFGDDDLQLAFREARDFSEESQKQAIDFIKYLKEKEEREGRKPKK
ncbi:MULTISPECIES: helix-turn-helix domain-containing protein [Bacillus]|uniref:helix-turn-helix domain-containing protein n=1 Tax=Bacillus TaxID=1386 RepID=UPI00026BA5BE|nr:MULTISPECIES: helix-turn-helix transcriptional regulator [Bacillus]AIW31017.1 XRE family transcriptional regulator [Bacillus subtilis]EJD67892.1 DNA-binding protein [Bacillus sp. 916]MBU8887491.1 helix-turn-helix domain-containing protein [Bacillus sp. FJAT-27001]CDG30912.1 HTH-type transcriptional regulator Xre [Bacillus velezensis UCMB5033]